MESWRPHSMSPFLPHQNQAKNWQRRRKIDKGKRDPSILKANFRAQLHGVKPYRKAKQLAAKIEQ